MKGPGPGSIVLERDGGGTGATPIILGGVGDVLTPGDYDGDGVHDPGVWNPDTGEFTVLRSSTGTTLTHTLGGQNDYPLANWRVH